MIEADPEIWIMPSHLRAFEFRQQESQIVTQTIAPSWQAYADKLSAGGDSVLARLTEDELVRGLAAVRQQHDGPDGPPVVEPIDVLFFR